MKRLHEELKEICRCPDFRIVTAKSAVVAFAFACLGSWVCCELCGTFDQPHRIPTARPSKLITKLAAVFAENEKPSHFRMIPQASGSEADIPNVQPPPLAPTLTPQYMKYLGFHGVPHMERQPIEAPRPPIMIDSEGAASLMEAYEKWKRQPFRPTEEFFFDDRTMPILNSYGSGLGDFAPPQDSAFDSTAPPFR
ncbi:hypothetical protein [Calycomorphotria hydatis]|uniref:Uncharacterized protein n=1 Tax=Calycomorphotria hydatis TaxID=2528027 RepID=A0A517TDN9_9PLAN|nr:hypothetical protein [Calycomorphotria hydatis]QDT66477.1 hypothetical protein V22_37450 [Calycomorphotria hydatis]